MVLVFIKGITCGRWGEGGRGRQTACVLSLIVDFRRIFCWCACGGMPRLALAMTPEEIRILRAMTPAQKLAAAEDMYRAARDIKAAALRAQHPDWSEEEVRRKVREIFLH